MFSKLKKKVKHRLAGGKHKPGRTGPDAGGETIDAAGSLPRPEPHVVVGGGSDQGGSGANAVGEQVFPANQPLRPGEPVLAPGGGGEDDQGGGEAGVDGREGSQRRSVGSGPGRDGDGADGGTVEQVHPSPSTPPLVQSGNPDGTRTQLFWFQPLIVPSNNVLDTSTAPDHVPGVLGPDKTVESNVTPDEKKSDWKSTASATAKLLLRGVRDSSDAFGPLKSVASSLCFILENCKVRSSSRIHYPQRLRMPQRMKVNKQAIELLAPRIKALSTSLCAPVSEGGDQEATRREELGR
jgi:hypothetical protein